MDKKTQWVLAMTQPAREVWAAENVSRQGCRYYLPRYKERKLTSGRVYFLSKPLFPRYIFVQITDKWRFLASTMGIQSVVMRGNDPEVVPDRVIKALEAKEDPEGYIALETRPANAGYEPGQPVQVTDGPFQGARGLYVGQTQRDRQRILLELLGQETFVTINAADLSAAK